MVAALALTWAPCAVLAVSPHPVVAQDPAAQSGRVTGVVNSETGQPVPGAQVTVVGTSVGAVTGDDGRYNIVRVPPGTYQVRAQRIGFAAATLPVTVVADEAATVDFSLAPVATTLTTQVVVGYTTQQRRDVSDAVAGVTGEEIRDQKVATVEEALRGRIPGVQVASTGEPGRPAQIIIRGQNFLGNPTPLYVVDGTYMSQNPNLNPDDIASIEVLKDASAAAQYGAQAANGVVVITTKRGSSGPNRVELRSYYGFQDIPERIDMMSAQQWSEIATQAYLNAGWALDTMPEGVKNPTANTDWQDAIFQRGAIQDHNLSVSGGTPNASYLISGGYLNQTGAILETGFDRYSFRVNSEARRGRFTLGENLALSSTNRQGLNGFPLIDALRMLPNIPVRDPNNASGYGFGSGDNPTFGVNPVGQQEIRDNELRSRQVFGTGYAEAALPFNLRYRFNLGLNFEDFENRDFTRRGVIRLGNPDEPARLRRISDNTTSLQFENLLTYDNSFSEGAHRLNAVAGYSEQKQEYERLQAYREGYTDEELDVIDAGGRDNLDNAGFRDESGLRAFLLRANYAFRDRYLLTGSVRRDGSSRFSEKYRWGTFGAVSAGWVLSEEGFYQSLPLFGTSVPFFKLRASTGVLGNQDIGNYRYDASINYAGDGRFLNYLFGGEPTQGAIQLSLANPNIKWQSNQQSNFGVDLGMLDNRLNLTADYYVSESDGLLVSAPVPWSLGVDPDPAFVPVVNAGTIRNNGFEVGLTHRYERGGFQFNSSANLTTTRNKVLELGNGNQPIYAGPEGISRTAVGGPIGEFFVYKTAGIFQTQAEVDAHTTTVNGTPVKLQADAKPGDIRYVDVNGDGIINDLDRYTAGSPVPDFTYGMFFDGKFRAFDFGLNLRGSVGNKIFNVARFWTDRMDDLGGFREGLQPWTQENPSTTTPRAVWGTQGAANARLNSDRWIESGTFLRIQNLVVGYTLPTVLMERTGLGAVQPRIYVNVQNLHTFTDFSNWDPETLGGSLENGLADPLARGIDDGRIFPNVRTITFGLDLRL